MARPKSKTPKKRSTKKAMADAIAEARSEMEIKPIKRASKGAKYLKASPYDKYVYRKIRLHNGTIECDTDEMFDAIAKQVLKERGEDITKYKTTVKEKNDGEDQADT